MTSNSENNIFWLDNPLLLIKNFTSFNPFTQGELNYVLNAYTRFILIVTVFLLLILKNKFVLVYAFIAIIFIIFIYKIYNNDTIKNLINNYSDTNLDIVNLPQVKSDYENPQKNPNNPLKNTMIPEYDKIPTNSGATESDYNTSKFVEGKMFQTEADYVFDQNTRQYYTMPNTLVPNEQNEFANWLYGTENNCKSGSIYSHRTGTPESAENCNGFNVSVPTNFGKL